MKVILLKEIKGIGEKNSIKEVSPGYANNYLFPNKLAVVATDKLIKEAEESKKREEEAKREQGLEHKEQAKKIEGKRFIIKVKTGEEGQLFEAVHPEDIATKIKENGYNIGREQIIIDSPIKELGEFKIKVRFEKDIEAETIIVINKE